MEKKNINSEVNRCLTCKNNARCSSGCPVSTVIPEVIDLYKQGKIEKAGEILFNNNPLSLICSIVCPHEENCMGNCILGIKGEPIDFPTIEKEISSKYLLEGEIKREGEVKKRVAIIGSGPSGIALAFILARKGYNITIFEKNSKLGGILRYGIPEFRLPKDILDLMEKRLVELGVKIRYNDLIGPVNNVEDLLADGYDSVFIGTGVWNPRPLKIPGETLGHVHYAINYLKSPNSFNLGKRVVVIGAGNVAMDAARTAKKNGAKEVFILYRRGRENMSATSGEIKEAEEDGVKIIFYIAPEKIVDEGIRISEMVSLLGDDNTRKLEKLDGSESLFLCSSVIIAVSQNPSNNIVTNNNGNINIGNTGLVITDELGNTSKKGIYASGDVVTGAKTVVEAVRDAKVVAETIDIYLSKAY